VVAVGATAAGVVFGVVGAVGVVVATVAPGWGRFSTCPASILSGSVMLLNAARAAALTPNCFAISDSASPDWMT